MQPFWWVFVKEVVDNARDRRSTLAALVYPLLGPLLFASMLHFTASALSGGSARDAAGLMIQPLPVAGAEYAPKLMDFLHGQGIQILAPPADIEQAVKRGRWPIILKVSEGFDTRLAAGDEAELIVYNDASRLSGEVAAGHLSRLLGEYRQREAERRLEKHGVPVSELTPFTINNVIYSTRRKVADLFVYLVPPFIMFTVFIGGVYLAIDATAGERERGSLEPLMTLPVPRWLLMLGKYMAAFVFTAFALTLQMVAFYLAFQTVDAESFSEGTGFFVATALHLMLTALPLMAFTVGIQMIIAALTRSFKEAQTWLGLLPIGPAIPGLAMVFLPVGGKLWMMLVPVLSQVVVMGEIVRGTPVSLGYQLAAAVATLAAATVLLVIAGKLYERDEIIFGGI